MDWQTDILGEDFAACPFQTTGPDGVERTATLVRHIPASGAGSAPRRAVLFLHGWSDYFFNEELAEFWTGQGFVSSHWTCTTTAGACGPAPTAATSRTWPTTTPRSRRRSASSSPWLPRARLPRR